MYLQQRIKLLSIFILFVVANTTTAQSDSLVRVPSPYRTEYNPWYKLTRFQRGFEKSRLIVILDSLEAKPRKEWSRSDSLEFAEATVHTGNIDLSEYYFNALNVSYTKEEKYWWDQMMVFIQNGNYEAGIESIHKSSPGILEYSKIYFLDRILLTYLHAEENPKWYKDTTYSVLRWKIDTTLFSVDKESERFQREVIQPLENLDFVLKEMIHYIHEEDAVLAKACNEMGIIFENHISLTQAYISYSLGRHYNKWDKEILNNVKSVKARLSEKRYKIPIFRRYFPRIKEWRFDYQLLKEKIYNEKKDTSSIEPPSLMLKPDKKRVPFNPELIGLIGLFLLFILVLIFLKTKK